MSIKDSPIIRRIKDFSLTEKIAFYIFALLFVTTGLGLLLRTTDGLFVSVPATGGSLSEGIIGYPRYINPVLNITESGRDLSSLIYAGLLKENGDGTLEPDLAESYNVSADGLIYDVYLKKDLTFHDGTPVTADDVLFTIDKVKDVNLKSPEYVNWQGVTATKVDDYHIQFMLRTAYTPFAYNLTLGILPKHIWQNINDDQFSFSTYNYEPIGAGPYQFVDLKRDSDGLPLYYELKAFKNYASGAPYIQNIAFYFFKDAETALLSLKSGRIDSVGGVSQDDLKDFNLSGSEEVKAFDLLRTFAVYLNQNQSEVLVNKEVRQALDASVDRKEIIDWVLGGYGTPVYSPVPSDLLATSTIEDNNATSTAEDDDARIQSAREILTDNGWTPGDDGVLQKKTSNGTTTLAFTLSTSDNQDLKETADLLKETWEKLGAKVDVQTYDSATLNQDVIRPRKYEALLFGEVVGHDADLYPFWHSSQRNDPGLNVAMYTNIKADKALEEERSATTTEDKMEAYSDFNDEIMKDIPAVFLYSPQYLYVVPRTLQGFSSNEIEAPEDRFNDIEKEYVRERKVLKIFYKDPNENNN